MLYMLQSLTLDSKYVYDKYQVYIHYQIPELNQSEYSNVAIDLTQSPRYQYIDYLNASKIIMDKQLINLDENLEYYTRTHKDHYECLTQENYQQETLPDLSQFEILAQDEILNLKHTTHFRFYGTYEADNQDSTYVSNQTYQQDFWCYDYQINGQTKCVPFRWEIRGRSNFDSHQSYYLIEYYNFTTTVDQSLFEIDSLCEQQMSTKSTQRHSRLFEMIEDNKNIINNLNTIAKIQANKNFTFTVGPNQFLHYGRKQLDSLKSRRLHSLKAGERPDFGLENCTYDTSIEIPNEFGFADLDGQVWIQDQAWGGSCWAQATAKSLSYRISRLLNQDKTYDYQQVEISAQQFVDCYWNNSFEDIDYQNNGVEGGMVDSSLWMLKNLYNSSLALARDYPYVGQNDYCKEELMTYKEFEVERACQIIGSREDIQRAIITGGPVAIGVSVPDSFTFYTGGIYNDPACGNDFTDLVHAVTLVGWGTHYDQDGKETPYYIVQNSWSSLWGQQGFIYIQMEGNICGVETDVSYAELKKRN